MASTAIRIFYSLGLNSARNYISETATLSFLIQMPHYRSSRLRTARQPLVCKDISDYGSACPLYFHPALSDPGGMEISPATGLTAFPTLGRITPRTMDTLLLKPRARRPFFHPENGKVG
jgi:hypothetical protein